MSKKSKQKQEIHRVHRNLTQPIPCERWLNKLTHGVLRQIDVVDAFKPWLDKKMMLLDPKIQKFRLIEAYAGSDVDSPWIYVKRDPHRRCFIEFQVLFNHMGVLPSRCMNCWKVVAKPKNVHDAVRLLFGMEQRNWFGKIGFEIRGHVAANWGAYFYNDSYEAGLEKLKLVKQLILDADLKQHCDVFLKRGCTEIEIVKGPSQDWQQSERDKHWEYLIKHCFHPDPDKYPQPMASKLHVLRRWIEHACSVGDMTYLDFMDEGEKLHAEYVHYPLKEEVTENGEKSIRLCQEACLGQSSMEGGSGVSGSKIAKSEFSGDETGSGEIEGSDGGGGESSNVD